MGAGVQPAGKAGNAERAQAPVPAALGTHLGDLGPVTPPLAYPLGVMLTPTGGDCCDKMHTLSHAHTQEAARFLREADGCLGSRSSVLPVRSASLGRLLDRR